MRRVWPLLAIGAVAYLLVLVTTFPAARMAPLLERQLAGLSLRAVSGTAFSGQAEQLAYHGLDLGRLTWQIRPGWLLLGRVQLQIELTDPGNPGQAKFTITPWGGIHGRDIQLALSPDRLVNRYSPVPVKTSGTVQLQIEKFKLADGFPQELAGMLRWDDGVVLDPIEIILGDVGMALHGTEDLITGTFVNGGRLEAGGEIRLFADGRYDVNLRLLPDNEMSDQTLSVLESMGQLQQDSSLIFKTNGRL